MLVGYKDLSPVLVEALIATEDVRFSNHSGIDVKALFKPPCKVLVEAPLVMSCVIFNPLFLNIGQVVVHCCLLNVMSGCAHVSQWTSDFLVIEHPVSIARRIVGKARILCEETLRPTYRG